MIWENSEPVYVIVTTINGSVERNWWNGSVNILKSIVTTWVMGKINIADSSNYLKLLRYYKENPGNSKATDAKLLYIFMPQGQKLEIMFFLLNIKSYCIGKPETTRKKPSMLACSLKQFINLSYIISELCRTSFNSVCTVILLLISITFSSFSQSITQLGAC